jgi:uncharacterized radical SAM superfamily Fe-S cluster-containing enzyme
LQLTCPVCFANANVAGCVYQPSINLVRKQLAALREQQPVAGRVVQFSGGEPTIHSQFFEILSMAREVGFSHVQAATNGIEFAKPGSPKPQRPPGSRRFTCNSTAFATTCTSALAAR